MKIQRPPSEPRRSRAAFVRPATLAACAALLIGVAPSTSRAGLMIQVLNSTAPIGGSGSFDVVLMDTGGTFQVSAFSVEISSAAPGVRFTAAGTGTTAAAYLFGTLQAPPLTFNTFPTSDFTASDSSLTPPYETTLNTGDMYGLEHVSYAVAAGTPTGPAGVSIVAGPGTVLTDVAANALTVGLTNGTITVSAAVPEPSSLTLAVFAGGLLASAWRIRSSRAAR